MDADNGLIVAQVWGRQYEFGPHPFLEAVESAGAPILAAPVRLAVTLNGTEHDWEAGPSQVLPREPHAASFVREFTTGCLHLSVRTTIEYDGMVLSDCRIRSARAATLDDLTLEVPLHEQHARYLYHFLGADRTPLTQIVRETGVVMLRIRMVQGGVELGPGHRGDLNHVFGFQATPAKALEADAWDYRTVHTGNYGIELNPPDAPATLTYRAAGNIEVTQGTLHVWVKPFFDTHGPPADQHLLHVGAEDADALRLSWRVSAAGCRLALRHGNDEALEVGAGQDWQNDRYHHVALTWGDSVRLYYDGGQVLQLARTGLPIGNADVSSIVFGGPGAHLVVDDIVIVGIELSPRQIAEVAAAQSSPVPDDSTLLLDHLDEEFAPGAIEHLDGTTGALPKTHPTKGEGQGVIGTRHGCAYARFVEGRFGNALRLGLDRPILDFLADAGVRTICFHRLFTFRQACAICLLHDVPVRANGLGPTLDLQAMLWVWADEFERTDAEWLSYWRNAEYVRAVPNGTLVSLYRHPRHGVTAVVANMASQPATVCVELDLGRLGLGEQVVAVDALTGEALAVADGAVTFELSSLDFRMVWLRSE